MSLVINISCTGSDGTKRVVLHDGDSIDIGRTSHDATLMVDPRLSRKHFSIRYSDGRIQIRHRSKTNPTLVASQGSSDFEKVKGDRTESNGCRIMAGSHRFILTVSKPDSEPQMGFSDDLSSHGAPDGSHDHFWSDVEPDSTRNEAGDHTASREPLRSQPPAETVPIGREELASEKVSNEQHATQPNVFFDDDDESVDEQQPDPPANPREKKPATKKPFFPLGDDFFDD